MEVRREGFARVRNAERLHGGVPGRWLDGWRAALPRWSAACRMRLARAKGQGTTEYAILVGVLVVIAILAITVFRPKLQELWDAIASGINGL